LSYTSQLDSTFNVSRNVVNGTLIINISHINIFGERRLHVDLLFRHCFFNQHFFSSY